MVYYMIRHNNSIFNIGGSIPCLIDLDASKVIEAVRSTGVTITPAMMHYAHYLISNMKAIGTWQLCNAVYGFVGGTAGSHKFNWKDLRDVDAAFRLIYSGTVTHSANGMQGNGTTGYANTFYNNPTLKRSLGYYVNTLGNTGVIELDMGSLTGANGFYLSNRVFNNFIYSSIGTSNAFYVGAVPKGFYNSSVEAGNQFISVNGSVIGRTAYLVNPSDTNSITIGSRNADGAIAFFSNKRFGFSYIAGSFFTESQSIQQSQIVTNAQNILNRA